MRAPDNGRACHPAVRPSSLRHYPLDEMVGSAFDLARGQTAGSTSPPATVQAWTPRARRFLNLRTDALFEASDPLLAAALLGDCTVAALFRPTVIVSGSPLTYALATLVAFSSVASGSAADNTIAGIQLSTAGQLRWLAQEGAGGDVHVDFASYFAQPFEWVLAHVRRSATTGPGPSGTCTIDLLINGALVESHPAQVNASDGGNGAFRIGHRLDASSNVIENGNVDIGGVYVYGRALTDDEIAADARRLLRLPFYTRQDLTVAITDQGGAERDLCNLEGIDFVDKAEVVDQTDQPTMTATVTLIREQEMLSLASLVTSAKPNLIDPNDPTSFVLPLLLEGGAIDIRAARMPIGIRARPSDMTSIFQGNIDDIEDGGEQIVLTCRDLGGRFIDTFIENEVNYGDPAIPYSVVGEMQFILNDNDNDPTNNSVLGIDPRPGSYPPIVLWTPVDPNWSILQFRQRREPVLTALRTLAAQIGFEVRFRYIPDPFAPGWRLSFYDPDRRRIAVNGVIESDDIIDVTRLTRSILGIRNVVRVVYPSSEGTLPTFPPFTLPPGVTGTNGWFNLDGDANRMVAFVELTSNTSIAAVGRRLFMETVEASSSQIDTVVEATRMAQAALLDLQETNLAKSITMPTIWEAELNDMLRFEPNPLLFTAAQTKAVKNVTHTFDAAATSTVELRGLPSIGSKRWLRIEARQGNGRPGVVDPREALTDMSTGSLLATFRNIIDRSSLLSGGKFIQVRNNDFSAFSAGLANPPDGWHMRAGVWGTDVIVDSANQLSGGHAIHFATATGAIVSDCVAIAGDPTIPYSVEMKWMRIGGGTYVPRIDVEWLDANKALISTTVLQPGVIPPAYPNFRGVDSSGSTWFQSRADGLHPPDNGTLPHLVGNAKFARFVIKPQSGGTFLPLVVDDIGFYRTARELVAYSTPNLAPGSNYGYPSGHTGWKPVHFIVPNATSSNYDLNSWDFGHQFFDSITGTYGSGSPTLDPTGNTTIPATGDHFGDNGQFLGIDMGCGFYAREDMSVQINVNVAIAGNPGDVTSLRLVRNANYDTVFVNSAGTPLIQSASVAAVATSSLGDPALTGTGAAGVALMNLSIRVSLARGDRISVEFLDNTGSMKPIGFNSSQNVITVKQDISQ